MNTVIDWPWWASMLPAAAAALGLFMALIFLGRAVRLLTRKFGLDDSARDQARWKRR